MLAHIWKYIFIKLKQIAHDNRIKNKHRRPYPNYDPKCKTKIENWKLIEIGIGRH